MRRELHERFMPDRVRTDNIIKLLSITFLSTELSTARARERKVTDHESACFQSSIAAEFAVDTARLWRTIAFEYVVYGNQ